MKKILIIDNSNVTISLFRNILTKELGMEVFVSKSIEDSKELLSEHSFFYGCYKPLSPWCEGE